MSRVNTYDIGDGVDCDAEFRNAAGVLADPTTVRYRVFKPDGTTSTFTHPDAAILHPGGGLFTGQVVPDAHGWWSWDMKGTGAIVGRHEGIFYVRRSRFATP